MRVGAERWEPLIVLSRVPYGSIGREFIWSSIAIESMNRPSRLEVSKWFYIKGVYLY